MLKIKDKDFVIPGEFLGEQIEHDFNCFREDKRIFSSIVGMTRANEKRVNVIPSSGVYIPKEEDVIIGVVKEALSKNWILDINSPYTCLMSKDDVFQRNEKIESKNAFKIGDILSVKIASVDEVHFSRAIKPWKLEPGLILEVDPKRVPRVIGKKRSMLNLLKEKTKSRIIVGQNGRIWIKGPNDNLVAKVIKKIVREAQTQGLTDRIENLLNEEVRK